MATNTKDELNDKLSSAKKEMVENLANTKDVAQHAAEETLNLLKNKASDLNKYATNKLKDYSETVKDTAITMNDCMVSYIRENPLKSLGFGMLAGAILALILKPRK